MSDYVSSTSFADLPLSDELRRGIGDRGYTTPTPVQAAVIGPILAGRDVICRSKTGTGKTAAFGIPILERIPGGTRKASALVLCNTRELALQVSQELEALAAHCISSPRRSGTKSSTQICAECITAFAASLP